LLEALRANCYAYIHGHEVGGTNPSLLEALGCGNPVLALDSVFNREVAGDAALYFQKNPGSLAEKIEFLERSPQLMKNMRKKSVRIVKEKYSLDQVMNEYLSLFNEIADLRQVRRL